MRIALVRALLAGAGLLILGFLGASLVIALMTGRPNWPDLSNLLLALFGLMLLYRAAVPRKTGIAPACLSCGSRIHETLRSDDRRRVYTCFACGRESPVTVPRYGPGTRTPEPPRPG